MAGLGAKLFTSFSKLTAAQVNGYLADQTIMRFASVAARDAAFGGVGEPTLAEGMTCYLDDTNVLQSYTGSAWVSVADSTSPRILQIVQSPNDTTIRSSSTTTYVDTGLSLTLTPKSINSKILVTYSLQLFSSGATTGVGVRLMRDATVVVADIDNTYGTGSGNSAQMEFYYIDSPSTTSATTYKIQFNRNQGINLAYINASGAGTARMYAIEFSS